MSLDLSRQTKARIKVVFHSQTCHGCGKMAERFRLGKYYCNGCVPVSREVQEQRHYRIPILHGHLISGRYGKSRSYLSKDLPVNEK